METVQSYLDSVKRFLPMGQQDDIIRELSDDILSQIEDREGELDRPLTKEEIEVILKRHGTPMEVAGRYHTSQDKVAFGKTWIGPVLFPIYVRVLGISLAAALVIRVIVFVALAMAGADVTVEGTLGGVVTHLLVQSLVITVIFTAVQLNESLLPDGWVPGKKDKSDPNKVSRWESFFELAILIAVFLWLVSVWTTPSLQFGAIPAEIQLAPIWEQIYVPLMVLVLAEITRVVINLFKPEWARFKLVAKVISGFAWLGFLGFLLTAGQWVNFTNESSEFTKMVNDWVYVGLVITAIVSAVTTLWDIVKLVRSERKPRMMGVVV